MHQIILKFLYYAEMATLFKVWSLTARKAVMASSLEELVFSGKSKLNLQNNVSAYMEDGTEVDDNDIFCALPAGTVIYLLTGNDPVNIFSAFLKKKNYFSCIYENLQNIFLTLTLSF